MVAARRTAGVNPRPLMLAACVALALSASALPVAAESGSARLDVAGLLGGTLDVAHWPQALLGSTQRRESVQARIDALLRGGPIVPITNCNDAGPGSLRDAMLNAVDTTRIDASGLACSTITLTTGALTTPVAHLAVSGPGRDGLAIDGGGNDRVIHHGDGTVLVLEGLTVRNGVITGGGGGCVLAGDTLYMVDSRATGCSSNRYGGGIRASGDIGLISSEVTASHAAEYGGGVSATGTLLSVASTISGNSVEGSWPFGSGGGGAHAGGDTLMYFSTISDNDVTLTSVSERGGGGSGVLALGGGLMARGQMLMAGSRVSGNTLTGTGEQPVFVYGGGMYSAGASFVVGSTISGNTAHSQDRQVFGGGVQVGSYLGGSLLVSDESGTREGFSSAARRGGGEPLGLSLVLSTISGNQASSSCLSCYSMGGGAGTLGGLQVKYSTVSDNAIIASSSGAVVMGGGLGVIGSGAAGSVDMYNSTISGNQAMNPGGGIGAAYGGGLGMLESELTLSNSTIALNEATHRAGGISAGPFMPGSTQIDSSIIATNSAPTGADIAARNVAAPITITGTSNLVQSWSAQVTMPPDTLALNPQLLALACNGGPTQTHALPPGSPAVDAGSDPLGLEGDQRTIAGYVRVFGVSADIGAYELQPPPDLIFTNGFDFDVVNPACN